METVPVTNFPTEDEFVEAIEKTAPPKKRIVHEDFMEGLKKKNKRYISLQKRFKSLKERYISLGELYIVLEKRYKKVARSTKKPKTRNV